MSAAEVLERVKEKAADQTARSRALASEIERCSNQIEKLKKESFIRVEAAELLIAGAKISRERTIGFVENVVTLALQGIMQDPTLKFVIETEQRRGVLEADYLVEWKSRGVTVRRPPLKAKGGSLWSIISAALHFLFLLRVKPRRRPLLVIDEPEKGINGENIVRFAKWLRRMAEEFRVQLVIISHREEFTDVAGKVYRVLKNTAGVARVQEE